MKIGAVNKSTILNRFVFHALQRNITITHLAVIKDITNIKLGSLKGRKLEKSLFPINYYRVLLKLENKKDLKIFVGKNMEVIMFFL